MKFKLSLLLARVVGGWVLDFTRLMLISTQVKVVVEVGVELGNIWIISEQCLNNIEEIFGKYWNNI